MLILRRTLMLVAVVLVLGYAGYVGWLALQVRADLAESHNASERIRAAAEARDRPALDAALDDLTVAASDARARTAGPAWGLLTRLPLVGDDATGVRALSGSLDTVASHGVAPLADALDLLDDISAEGRVDLGVLERLHGPVTEARAAFDEAAAEVDGLDSSGYAGAVRSRFDDYVELTGRAATVLGSAETATQVLPGMVGADGPRDYLLVFQNNAEIRATGGMPGSWALMHTDSGALELRRQGKALPHQEQPILPLSDEELAVYDRQLGTYWQDAGFTPDFPRAAELWSAHFAADTGVHLDGVISLDPVAMSYLLEGTGPVEVAGGLTLTADNVVAELLNQPYLTLEPEAQDVLFAKAARAIFDAATGELADPLAFVDGLGRAAAEGRLLVVSYDQAEAAALAGTRVVGALAGDDGDTPHVDIGLNDATGSKMSYYLRYHAQVRSLECDAGQQRLTGSMSLSQSIPASEAASLPVSVTGGGNYGTEPGSQLVLVRLYGPYGGTLESIRLNGRNIRVEAEPLDGRPVATVVVLLSSTKDVTLTWMMETGAGQTGDGELGMTPSIVPGSNDAEFSTAC